MTEVVINFIQCHYCGARFGNNLPGRAMANHWRECPHNPARPVIEELTAALEAINAKIDNDIVEYGGPHALYHVPLSNSEIVQLRAVIARARGER